MTEQIKKYVNEIYSFAKANNDDIGVAVDKLRPEAENQNEFKKAEELAKEYYFEIVKQRKEGKSVDEILDDIL